MEDSVSARVSRAEEVAGIIEIEASQLEPRSRLGTKEHLKQRFGVAAGTLNESLRLLQARGIVEPRPGPGGGVFVASPGPAVRLSHLILKLQDDEAEVLAGALEVRNALEPVLALEASRVASKVDIAEMYEYIDDMEQAIDDPDGFFRANWSLHRKLAAIVPNVVLQTVYLTLLELAEEHIATVSSDPTFSRTSPANVAAHRELVAAIASKDAQRIRLAVDRHEPLAGRRDVPSAHADGPNKLAV